MSANASNATTPTETAPRLRLAHSIGPTAATAPHKQSHITEEHDLMGWLAGLSGLVSSYEYRGR